MKIAFNVPSCSAGNSVRIMRHVNMINLNVIQKYADVHDASQKVIQNFFGIFLNNHLDFCKVTLNCRKYSNITQFSVIATLNALC